MDVIVTHGAGTGGLIPKLFKNVNRVLQCEKTGK